jgi:hypothetical protein
MSIHYARMTRLSVLAGLASLGSAHAATCPTSTFTTTLSSTAAAPKTDADIQMQLNLANRTKGGVVKLNGTFQISHSLIIGSCTILQSASASAPATLQWADKNIDGVMLINPDDVAGQPTGIYGVQLKYMRFVGRGVSLNSYADGTANHTLEGNVFLNVTAASEPKEGYAPNVKAYGGSGWTFLNNQFIVDDPALLAIIPPALTLPAKE